MVSRKVMKEYLELTIPTPIINKSRALKTSNAGDVSRSYNITLKSPKNENLFVDNEEDLRDLLQDYLTYKKLEKAVQENRRKQNAGTSKGTGQLDDTNENKNKKGNKRTTKITRIEYYRTPGGSQSNIDQIHEEGCCSHDCKGIVEQKKRSCCVIL